MAKTTLNPSVNRLVMAMLGISRLPDAESESHEDITVVVGRFHAGFREVRPLVKATSLVAALGYNAQEVINLTLRITHEDGTAVARTTSDIDWTPMNTSSQALKLACEVYLQRKAYQEAADKAAEAKQPKGKRK